MSKARELANLGNAYSDGALSNRNLIINGAMQVAQRGTSQTTQGYGSIDRMALSLSGATATMTQETLALGQTDLPSQFRKFARIATTTGDNNCGLYHRIEDVDTAEGEVTLSFYAKGTNPASGAFDVYLYQSFGSGGSTGVITTAQSLTLTSSWQRFEFVFTLASLSGKTIGTGSNIEIGILQPNADTGTAAWTLDITGVQLEVGDTATPFEHRSYGDELARCQRYFTKIGDGKAYTRFGSGLNWSTGGGGNNSIINLPVTLRAFPTLTTSGVFAIYHGNAVVSTASGIAIETVGSSLSVVSVNVTTSGLTQGYFGTLIANNSTAATLQFDAEL